MRSLSVWSSVIWSCCRLSWSFNISLSLIWSDLLQNPPWKKKKDVPCFAQSLQHTHFKNFALSEWERNQIIWMSNTVFFLTFTTHGGCCCYTFAARFSKLHWRSKRLSLCHLAGAGWYSLCWSRREILRADWMMHSRPKLTPTTL